jgi:hypothetical protein
MADIGKTLPGPGQQLDPQQDQEHHDQGDLAG